jgi:ferrous iron transport protein B
MVVGPVVDGCYLVVRGGERDAAPMAIFFPLFTLLEDLGYLPLWRSTSTACSRAAGARQAVVDDGDGFGCNAAGVVATRIIESPRERLVAILTNNFALCKALAHADPHRDDLYRRGVPAAWSGLLLRARCSAWRSSACY